MHQTPVHTNGRHTGSITPFLNSNICISTDRSMLPSRNKPIQFNIIINTLSNYYSKDYKISHLKKEKGYTDGLLRTEPTLLFSRLTRTKGTAR